jgi:hypothetical protein
MARRLDVDAVHARWPLDRLVGLDPVMGRAPAPPF